MAKNKQNGAADRKLFSAKIRKPLIKALKQIALDNDTELYLIVEDAIQKYVAAAKDKQEKEEDDS